MSPEASAPIIFQQRMGKDVVIRDDRIVRGTVSIPFEEIDTIRYRMMQDFDTRDPWFEFAAADGRKIKLMELARMREIFGLVRGRMVPVLAERLHEQIGRGGVVRFPEVFERRAVTNVLGVLFILLGLGLGVLMLFASGTGLDPEMIGVAILIAAPIALMGAGVMVFAWWKGLKGMVVTAQGLRTSLGSGAMTVPWDEVRGVRITDIGLTVYVQGRQGGFQLAGGAVNQLALPALLRRMNPDLPMDWKLKQTRPRT